MTATTRVGRGTSRPAARAASRAATGHRARRRYPALPRLRAVPSSVPNPSPRVQALPAYRPGKSAEQAAREHAIERAIKLASNENPYDPLPSVRRALAAGADGLGRYPDHRASAVREALAGRLGLGAEQVAVGCGSVGLLQQLFLTYCDPGDEALYGWRSFEVYPIYALTVGATRVQVPNVAERIDMAGITAAVTERTRLVLVTSPNNPTGTTVTHDEVVALLGAVPDGCMVVLDEAYYEYVTAPDAPRALELVAAHPNFAVLRTFSKAYGLASLRIGYLMGDPEVVGAVDRVLFPFAVNGLAQVAALASLEAEAELKARVDVTLDERARVVAALAARGLRLPDAQANFVWLPAGAAAGALCVALEQRGVVTRPFEGEGVRVTIGTPDENDTFLRAFDDAAAGLGLAEAWLL